MSGGLKIKKGDVVSVITGVYKGERGERKRVLRVMPDRRRLVVENVNIIHKHLRRTQKNPQGGRLSKEAPIDVSNVMLICPRCDKPARVTRRRAKDGGAERVCKKCGEVM